MRTLLMGVARRESDVPLTRRSIQNAFVIALCGLACCCSFLILPSRAAGQWLACGNGVAVDYEAVFDQMPKLPVPSSTGRVRFGPSALRVIQNSESAVQPPGGGFGYVFYFNRVDQRLRLRWVATVEIVEISSKGEERRVVTTQKRPIRSLKSGRSMDFIASLPGSTGLYRYDLNIRNQSGQPVGALSHYVRVLKPKASARLEVADSTLHRGEEGRSRLLNLGTTILHYGEQVEVEQLRETGWVPVPEFAPGPYIWPISKLYAGQAGGCEAFRVPETAAPGKYRLVKRLASFSDDKSRIIHMPFEVVE